jgi:O-antigen/teichoic acid export membrane protein
MVPVAAGCAVGLAAVLGESSESVLLVAICCISMAAGTFNDVLIGGLHGRQQMKAPALWSAGQQYLSSACSLVVLATTKSLPLYMVALVSWSVLPLLANLRRLWPELAPELGRIDVRLWRTIAVGGAPFVTWSAVQLVYGKIDIPLLESMAGSRSVGWYSIAFNWVSMPVFFAAIVSTAFYPSLAEHGKVVDDVFRRLGNQSLRLVMFVGLPAATGIALVADDVFGLLHYPSDYRNAIPLMRILVLHIPIVGMDIMLGLMLMATDRQRPWILVGAVAMVVNIGVNLFAIPFSDHHWHNGAIGASVVTVLTELTMMIGAIVLRPAGILDKATTGYILRCTVASAAMVVPVLALRDTPLALQVLVGGAVYVATSIAVRTLSLRTWRTDLLPSPHSIG